MPVPPGLLQEGNHFSHNIPALVTEGIGQHFIKLNEIITPFQSTEFVLP